MRSRADMSTAACDGLPGLVGERIVLLCANYIYEGILVGLNGDLGCCVLDDASIVYETGAWSAATWKNAEKMGDGHFVQLVSIESFRRGK